jgi:hypothetical protein
MLEYVYALSLLSITITLFYLTRSCFQFKGEIPYQGVEISNRIDKVHGVLDELADIINDISQASPIQEFAQTPPNPLMAIAQAFLTPKPIAVEHGHSQETQRTIHEIDETNKTQTETILD